MEAAAPSLNRPTWLRPGIAMIRISLAAMPPGVRLQEVQWICYTRPLGGVAHDQSAAAGGDFQEGAVRTGIIAVMIVPTLRLEYLKALRIPASGTGAGRSGLHSHAERGTLSPVSGSLSAQPKPGNWLNPGIRCRTGLLAPVHRVLLDH
ncbi:hypothetical protein D3C87_1116250 [compost metagenome]